MFVTSIVDSKEMWTLSQLQLRAFYSEIDKLGVPRLLRWSLAQIHIGPGEDSDCDDPGHDDCFDGGSRSQAGSGAKNRDPGSPPSTWPRPGTQSHSFGVSWNTGTDL